jgi:hypothetical protein
MGTSPPLRHLPRAMGCSSDFPSGWPRRVKPALSWYSTPDRGAVRNDYEKLRIHLRQGTTPDCCRLSDPRVAAQRPLPADSRSGRRWAPLLLRAHVRVVADHRHQQVAQARPASRALGVRRRRPYGSPRRACPAAYSALTRRPNGRSPSAAGHMNPGPTTREYASSGARLQARCTSAGPRIPGRRSRPAGARSAVAGRSATSLRHCPRG